MTILNFNLHQPDFTRQLHDVREAQKCSFYCDIRTFNFASRTAFTARAVDFSQRRRLAFSRGRCSSRRECAVLPMTIIKFNLYSPNFVSQLHDRRVAQMCDFYSQILTFFFSSRTEVGPGTSVFSPRQEASLPGRTATQGPVWIGCCGSIKNTW